MVGRSSHQEVFKVTIKNIAKAGSVPRQTSEMDPFARTFNRLKLLTILPDIYIKNAILDVLVLDSPTVKTPSKKEVSINHQN